MSVNLEGLLWQPHLKTQP